MTHSPDYVLLAQSHHMKLNPLNCGTYINQDQVQYLHTSVGASYFGVVLSLRTAEASE